MEIDRGGVALHFCLNKLTFAQTGIRTYWVRYESFHMKGCASSSNGSVPGSGVPDAHSILNIAI
ncbi:hypothetical protein AG1IA_06640 [Rhizoctonia solani AG-1 IA]|uniref:Uncharacterized protein n=1 Tax=Thanatephorus cucumeris (strain AG1-IA) TaxID=983506 RepID=L8WN11_THACA|nr:hypothetical protein AG1IA_06640 [Rhizoctonia solani AG-1 IA]